MLRPCRVRRLLLGAVAVVLLLAAPAEPQGKAKFSPKLEAVAETRLLMEGIHQANFLGLNKLLGEKPASAEAWTFARGQALLIAESGNLLMLRPPRNAGETAWQEYASLQRTAATQLARSAAGRDYERTRAWFAALANTCNRCHQTFRVPVQLVPFAEQPVQRVLPAPSQP